MAMKQLEEIESKVVRNVQMEGKIKNKVEAMIGMPVEVAYFSAATEAGIGGTTATDEEAEITVDDRAVKVEIERSDAGCEWAYEHDVSVYNNIERLDNLLNNGFEVVINEDVNESRAKKAKLLMENKIKEWKLQAKTSVLVKIRAMYGFGIFKKIIVNGDIIGLLEIDCNSERCIPVRNSLTGDLGGEIGKGLDPNDSKKEVALIQKGKLAGYDSEGNVTYHDKMFYFEREEILYWTNNDRGKFKGTSPVRRILRLVEIKKTLENVVDLVVRRFGPQIWIIVGTENYNLSNTRIPASYMRDANNNPVDEATARTNYKEAVFSNIKTNVQKWTDGETLVQIAEFGVDAKTFTPNTNLFQYSKYIDLCADYIKVGIFGLDIAGRVDVTSAIMQDRLFRDIKDMAKKERAGLIDTYNAELTNPTLANGGFKENCIRIEFKPLDKTDDMQDALMEFRRSQAVKNYLDAGTSVPKYLLEKWDMDISLPKAPTSTKEQKEPKKETLPKKTESPVEERTQTEVNE